MSLIGKVVEHDGRRYQIISEKNTMLLAHSYGDNCGIEETVFISKEKLNIVATKTEIKEKRCSKQKSQS